MGLIAGAGDSRSYCMEAMEAARDGKFEDARSCLEKASQAMAQTHDVQTGLIREEIAGEGQGVSLLMVHAQDHLSLALLMRDVAEEFIGVYERLRRLEGKQC
jgi:PTS system cellobiose-specific IIA component